MEWSVSLRYRNASNKINSYAVPSLVCFSLLSANSLCYYVGELSPQGESAPKVGTADNLFRNWNFSAENRLRDLIGLRVLSLLTVCQRLSVKVQSDARMTNPANRESED